MLASMELHEFCSMGGKARAAKLSSQRKSEIAKAAANARWKRTTLTQDVSKPIDHVKVADDIPKPRKCQMPLCNNQGNQVLLHGLKAWLCLEHSKR